MNIITQHTNLKNARERNLMLYRILSAVVHKIHGVISKYILEL